MDEKLDNHTLMANKLAAMRLLDPTMTVDGAVIRVVRNTVKDRGESECQFQKRVVYTERRVRECWKLAERATPTN